jgi:hypothetical protein
MSILFFYGLHCCPHYLLIRIDNIKDVSANVIQSIHTWKYHLSRIQWPFVGRKKERFQNTVLTTVTVHQLLQYI